MATATAQEILLFFATRRMNEPPIKIEETPYNGLLAELPSIHPSLCDPEGPPVWFIRLADQIVAALESSGDCQASDAINVAEAWNGLQMRERERFNKKQIECLLSLCQHYGVPEIKAAADWKQLAMALAMEHVPAFQVERAAKKRSERDAKKPNKLDVYGTACLFLCSYLDSVRKKRPLSATEEHYAKRWDTELKSRNLGTSTPRALIKQMRGAHLAYWTGRQNDFQRQFIEEVEPLIVHLFDDLKASDGTPTSRIGTEHTVPTDI